MPIFKYNNSNHNILNINMYFFFQIFLKNKTNRESYIYFNPAVKQEILEAYKLTLI